MADQNKRYGLFIPKSKKAVVKSTNVFDNDSDEDKPGMALINASLQKEADHAKLKRKTQLDIDKALSEDPTVFEYDNIYDNMQSSKTADDAKVKASKDKMPRYITGLLKAAEKRKMEQERMQERKIQKEREKEGDEFGDKEEFVTSAYVKKMKEMQEAEEKEKREAQMEAMLDVKNQKDMSGFYRYLLKEKAGEINHDDSEPSETMKQEEASAPVKSNKEEKSSSPTSSSSSSESSSDEEQTRSSNRNDREKYRPKSKDRSSKSSRRSSSKEKNSRRESDSYSSSAKDKYKSRRSRSRERSRSRDRKERYSSNSKYTERNDHRDRSKTMRERSRSGERDNKSKHRHERSHSRDRKHKSRSHERESQLDGRKQNSRDIEKVTKKTIDSEKDSETVEKEEKSTDVCLPTKEEGTKSKFARHTSDKGVMDAKARYLARKLAKERARPVTHDADG